MGFEVYLVGGAVRDDLLGIAVADRDWVVIGASVDELLNLGYRQIGNEFPCFLHPQTKEEYALARTEIKSGMGHTGFVCDFGPEITLEEDLSRRDLTINAIAKNAAGEYVDPYGGRRDLKSRTLRHVSAAFVEDPLRVLRVARFAARYSALGFTVHADTMALMQQLVTRGELSSLTPERVWKEMSRALLETRPSEFFRVLRACGALAVILPELDQLFGVPQPPLHHPEIDTGEHVMLAIDFAKQQFNSITVSWAVLLHDLGKGLTAADEWPKHIKHEVRGVPLVETVSKRFKVPKELAAVARLVVEHHLRCHRLSSVKPAAIMRLLEALDAFRRPVRVEYFTRACEADARGRLGFDARSYPQAKLLIHCMLEAKQVEIKLLLDQGYKGIKLAEQIRLMRIKAIAEYMASIKI
ncbi:MAG: multifunctional CCA addition/repair protein [Pseudomonadales bacterium]|nr:multifunctional CCA addition/repair protein [Pseudomonadales bacterium]